ncbi:MAG: hydrolase [Thermoprotei archaeon]|nr:MAG: hydrolase [Thermoprotei archaeon]
MDRIVEEKVLRLETEMTIRLKMPFTPFHIGPALLVGIPLERKMHLPTFIVANVILDLEPFLVLACGLNYPLHGYAHTLLGAFLIGVALALASRTFFQVLFGGPRDFRSYVSAGVTGTFMHVLLDSPLYSDIKPFYPLQINPLYNPQLVSPIYKFCAYSFLTGLAMYFLKNVLKLRRRKRPTT